MTDILAVTDADALPEMLDDIVRENEFVRVKLGIALCVADVDSVIDTEDIAVRLTLIDPLVDADKVCVAVTLLEEAAVWEKLGVGDPELEILATAVLDEDIVIEQDGDVVTEAVMEMFR